MNEYEIRGFILPVSLRRPSFLQNNSVLVFLQRQYGANHSAPAVVCPAFQQQPGGLLDISCTSRQSAGIKEI
jgi:hypothetical protein